MLRRMCSRTAYTPGILSSYGAECTRLSEPVGRHMVVFSRRCRRDVRFPGVEHALGLFDEYGKLKPIGRMYGELAREHRDHAGAAPRTTAIVVNVGNDGNPVDRSACGPGGSVCDLWMKAHCEGKRPTIVTSAVADDPERLAAQGITTLIRDVEPRPARFYTAVSDSSFEDLGEE